MAGFAITDNSQANLISSNYEYDGSAAYYEVERELFSDARKALSKGQYRRFQKLQKQLTDYPIAYYLEYEQIKKRIRTNAEAQIYNEIAKFSKITADTTLARKLTRTLLRSLAEKKKWREYLSIPSSKKLGKKCDYLLARIKTKKTNRFDPSSKSLWTRPIKHPDACIQAFKILERHDPASVSMVWTRIQRLMQRGQTAEISKMLSYLSKSDRKPIKSWLKVYTDPAKILPDTAVFDEDLAINRRIILSLMKKWAKRDAGTAYPYWKKVRKQYSFSRTKRFAIDRLIARMGAFDGLEQAHDWLHNLADKYIGQDIRYWRIRTAMRALDWPEVIRDIKSLPKSEQSDIQWRYWLAYAYAETGRSKKANSLFETLAKTLSYYGFLAADRLGLPYALNDNTSVAEKALKQRLMKNKALIIAREYHYAGLAWEGRREWMRVVAGLDSIGQYAVAELAKDWGWADRSVFTIAKTGEKNALALRFPMPHTTEVQKASTENAIEPAWIYGVMRRESGFIEDIRSGAGAIGLMQLMPATAREVARRTGMKRTGNLTSAKTNIQLGSFYLRFVLNKFNNNQILATAAYNAGPHRVKRWLPAKKTLPADVWIDTIPYTETRRYVRAVIAYTTIFEWRMHQRVTPLHKRMVDIRPKVILSQI